MKKIFLLIILIISTSKLFSQSYTSYFTGDTSDISTNVQAGTVLMGGATENDSAMVWFLKRAGGGDIVVLRASGSDGYNDYLYTDLGVTVNSVQTIVFNNASAASDSYVISQIHNAEAIWIAGGDQWDYITFWKNTAIENELNYLINDKKLLLEEQAQVWQYRVTGISVPKMQVLQVLNV